MVSINKRYSLRPTRWFRPRVAHIATKHPQKSGQEKLWQSQAYSLAASGD